MKGFKKTLDPALSTRFGGDGLVGFFGLANPVIKRPFSGTRVPW